MEYTIPLCDASKFSSFDYYTSLLSPIELESENNVFGDPVVDAYAMCILDAKYKQVNIHDVAFD